MTLDYVVRNGQLVVPGLGIVEADIGITEEVIVQIGRDLPKGSREIDATGKHVFPGCVDTHTHYGHFNEFYTEMETESDCLASLGVTTTVVLIVLGATWRRFQGRAALVTLLLFAYYSAQIFLLGAEFTRILHMDMEADELPVQPLSQGPQEPSTTRKIADSTPVAAVWAFLAGLALGWWKKK